MTATEKTKEALAQRVSQKQMTKSTQVSLSEIITGDYMKKQLEMALPVNLKNNATKYMRCYLSQIRTNPKLASCKMESVLGAMMTEAALGLDPTPTFGHAYIIPFKDEAQFIIGYKGLIELAYRAGIRKVAAYEVYENDEFDIVLGCEEKLIHKPKLSGDRGEITGYYATTMLPHGDYAFYYMSKIDMIRHKNRYSLSKSGPWNDNFDEMAKKTVIRKLFKYLPKATEFNIAISKDESFIHMNPEDEINKPEDVFDMQTTYPEAQNESEILQPVIEEKE